MAWAWHGTTDRAHVHALLSAEEVTDPRTLDIWVSEGPRGRAALHAELQARWPDCAVRVMSCYKPLVNFVLPQLEGWRKQPPRHLHLRYPVLPDAHLERFLLEAYPLAGWAASLGGRFTAEPRTDALPEYELRADGERFQIPVPLREGHAVTGEPIQRMTGRIVVDGALTADFPTAFEQLWDAYHGWLKGQTWPQHAPYFGVLSVTARFPTERRILHHDHEALDLTEVLAEELYFGTQEFFQRQAGVEVGSRTLQMGQIIPLVQAAPDEVTLEVRFDWHGGSVGASGAPIDVHLDVHSLDRPPTPAEVQQCLETLPGGHQVGHSAQGRPLWSFGSVQGRGRLLVTAGQHANESTGVVAALRAVAELRSQSQLGDHLGDHLGGPLTVIPLENPDGYALFHQLRQGQHPAHMHHAARYTALGDDLEYRRQPPLFERAGRVRACHDTPLLHVNLHGYPAHEWTRPLNGYVPQGFEAWTLPKGFCLIFRHRPDQAETAERLAGFVTRKLALMPDLMALNARQLAVFEAHTSARPYRVVNGTPCLFAERDDLDCPIVLITEYPDETVTGPDFLLGQQAQLEVIRSALAWVEEQIST